MRGSMALCVVSAVLIAGCGGHAHGPESRAAGSARITVTPARALVDVPTRVVISGLPANAAAELDASWKAFGGVVWRSKSPIHAGAGGRVVLAGLDGMRFIWNMRRPDPRRAFFGFLVDRPNRIALTLRQGNATLARTTYVRLGTTKSVRIRSLNVAKDGLYGFFLSPAARTRRQAVMALGGSDGGVPVDQAAAFAAHGYPALALGYFQAPGLPRTLTRIPLDYFARGLRWLARQPTVDPQRVVVEGTSRGGEAAMLIASEFPKLVHGAIGIVPNYETFVGTDSKDAWTLHGHGIPPFRPIHVERINGPVLVVSGGRDAVWESSVYTEQIDDGLRYARFPFPHKRLNFPKAGHAFAVPYVPVADPAVFGGTRRATAAAQAGAWRAELGFLRHLR